LVTLYTFEVITIDGAECDDQTAPSHRIDQLFAARAQTLQFLKSEPEEFKTKVIDAAIALEQETASLRHDDDLLCRAGMAEMQAAFASSTQTPITPAAPGYVGRQVAVTAPPGWTPKFVQPEIYFPKQAATRSRMRAILLKLFG
jgi:hypothetical protein